MHNFNTTVIFSENFKDCILSTEKSTEISLNYEHIWESPSVFEEHPDLAHCQVLISVKSDFSGKNNENAKQTE